MKLHFIRTALNGLLISAALISATLISVPVPEGHTILPYVEEMCKACEEAAKRSNNSAVAAIYRSKKIIVYEYDECIPYVLNNNDPIMEGYLCQQAICTVFIDKDPNCTGRQAEDPMPFFSGEIFYNAGRVDNLVMHSAKCERNETSITSRLPTCALTSLP